jgi:hypothetical protein
MAAINKEQPDFLLLVANSEAANRQLKRVLIGL